MAGTDLESPIPRQAWFPGKTVACQVTPSARAQEIAKRREELLGLLSNVPESEYELSLTDLVEKQSSVDDFVAERSFAEKSRNRSGGVTWPTKHKKTKSACSASGGVSAAGGGVLLNVFVPVSLTRSLTRSGSSVSTRSSVDGSKRDETLPGCLSVIWDRSKSRSRRHRGEADP